MPPNEVPTPLILTSNAVSSASVWTARQWTFPIRSRTCRGARYFLHHPTDAQSSTPTILRPSREVVVTVSKEELMSINLQGVRQFRVFRAGLLISVRRLVPTASFERPRCTNPVWTLLGPTQLLALSGQSGYDAQTPCLRLIFLFAN